MIKKFLCILIIMSCLGMTINANPNMQGDVGRINVPRAVPSIDGNINGGEGWSEGVYAYKDIMATFGNTNDIIQSFYLYYAYDSEGIYYAADILDNTFILSTVEDDIDNVKNDFNIKDENVYGYNGDIFTFVIDPLGLFLENGWIGNTDYTAWYNVGIFEGNICRMYRGHNRSGDITDQVKLAGHVTDGGWCFEAFLPWSIICQDTDELSYAELSPTVADMTSNDAEHRAMVIYLDRFYDEEGGEVTTYQRFATCGYVLADGLMGYLSSGMCLKAYGIVLDLEGTVSDPEDSTTTAVESSADITETEKITEAKTDNSKTENITVKTKATTKSQNTAKPAGNISGSAQTLDYGIAIGVGACIIAVILFIFVKKKL